MADFFMFWLVRPVAEFIGELLLVGVFLLLVVAGYAAIDVYQYLSRKRK